MSPVQAKLLESEPFCGESSLEQKVLVLVYSRTMRSEAKFLVHDWGTQSTRHRVVVLVRQLMQPGGPVRQPYQGQLYPPSQELRILLQNTMRSSVEDLKSRGVMTPLGLVTFNFIKKNASQHEISCRFSENRLLAFAYQEQNYEISGIQYMW